MSKQCGDCFYWGLDYGVPKCKKKNKRAESLDSACNQFVSETHQTCLDCIYSEALTGGLFVGPNDYKCTKTNKKVKSDTLSCGYFVG